MKLTSDGVKAGIYLAGAALAAYVLWKLYRAAKVVGQTAAEAVEEAAPVAAVATTAVVAPGVLTGAAGGALAYDAGYYIGDRLRTWFGWPALASVTSPSLDTMRGQGGIN